jgi:biotin transporter BioY
VHWAITLSTLSLLLVSLVIGMLFLGSVIGWDSSWLVSIIFIVAMLSLIVGLGCFLREIYLSKHTFQLTIKK